MAFEKAIFMTEPAMEPEAPDVAETANFLRRFAGLMSNGQNATYLHHAAALLETLTARASTASDEEQLWRYKYETVTHHADLLEAECNSLKHDIEGHLGITTAILTERDALKTALQAREAELSELNSAFKFTREELATKLQAHEGALVGLRTAFDREREALQSELKSRGDELAAFRVESDALKAEVAALEAKRAELRSGFDRISDLRNQTTENGAGAGRSIPDRGLEAAQPGDRDPAPEEAVVPKATLRQARAQFEYLAKECIRRGDIATQVMCELGAYTMDLALISGNETDHLPVGEVAMNILAPPGPTSRIIADTM